MHSTSAPAFRCAPKNFPPAPRAKVFRREFAPQVRAPKDRVCLRSTRISCSSHANQTSRPVGFAGEREFPKMSAPASSLVIFPTGKFQDRDRRIPILQSKRPNRSQHGFVVSQNPAQMLPLLFRQSLAVFPNNVGELRFHVP